MSRDEKYEWLLKTKNMQERIKDVKSLRWNMKTVRRNVSRTSFFLKCVAYSWSDLLHIWKKRVIALFGV